MLTSAVCALGGLALGIFGRTGNQWFALLVIIAIGVLAVT